MLSHEFLEKLAQYTIEIQKKTETFRGNVHEKGADRKDVVSGSDLCNEFLLRRMLKDKIEGLSFIFGEENGFERIGKGEIGAIIDPIDGTRLYTARLFYSAISVGFVDSVGKTVAGYIVSINNQWPDDLNVWTFDGETVRKNNVVFTKTVKDESMNRVCISITSYSALPERSKEIVATIFRLVTERSRGPLSFCSGAMEILSVMEGKIGACINIGRQDVVSHCVAIEIAKNLDFYVRHVEKCTENFELKIDYENGTVTPKESASFVVCASCIADDMDDLLKDAFDENSFKI